MTETKYWIGVASRDHVLGGVAGGFCQLNHGKAGPISRLKPGDWIVYYSPRETMGSGEPVQAFTAIGKIRPGEPYVGEMGGGMRATRRDVDFLKAREAAIRPLLETLSPVPLTAATDADDPFCQASAWARNCNCVELAALV